MRASRPYIIGEVPGRGVVHAGAAEAEDFPAFLVEGLGDHAGIELEERGEEMGEGLAVGDEEGAGGESDFAEGEAEVVGGERDLEVPGGGVQFEALETEEGGEIVEPRAIGGGKDGERPAGVRALGIDGFAARGVEVTWRRRALARVVSRLAREPTTWWRTDSR